jgi:preprotein translocase subunit SecB
MSEDGSNRQFAIQRIYTKDVSFETPNAPQVFTTEWKPNINVQLNTSVQDLGENHYELVLNVTVTAKQGDKTGFLAEVQQAGIFLISGVPDAEMGPMLGIFCPNILFPYAREAVSDLVNRGSFPQLNLAPVNFEALYAQQVQQQQSNAGDQSH